MHSPCPGGHLCDRANRKLVRANDVCAYRNDASVESSQCNRYLTRLVKTQIGENGSRRGIDDCAATPRDTRAGRWMFPRATARFVAFHFPWNEARTSAREPPVGGCMPQ